MADEEILYEKHPELFHYTNKVGLLGILESQTLWATHVRHLNDTTELQLMRNVMERRVFPAVKDVIVRLYRAASSRKKEEISNAGGPQAVARQHSRALADSFYRTSFEDMDSGVALATPYVTSFCAHTDDQDYERQNGLLSQWRGYAKEGGYAIVLDTKSLCDLYELEAEYNFYNFLHISDVVYSDDEGALEKEMGSWFDTICSDIPNYYESGNWTDEKVFECAWLLFTSFKHCGFREEREVRAVAFPVTKEIEDHHRRLTEGYKNPGRVPKMVSYRDDSTPYIEMFKDLNIELPIKRIIVGPRYKERPSDQRVYQMIKKKNIQIHFSETPLRW